MLRIFHIIGNGIKPAIEIRWLVMALYCSVMMCCYQPKNKDNDEKVNPESPDITYGILFKDVQNTRIFSDSKTFADCTPKETPEKILKAYAQQRKQPGFSLQQFVASYFIKPAEPPGFQGYTGDRLKRDGKDDIKTHIKNLWPFLSRQPDTVREGSSLLPLPFPYIVPGGRFREMYYWDSYFTMLGLKVSGRVDMMESMVKNFAFLINTYGHIPNGNRSYYLGRSQPPFFSMMVTLLAEAKNDKNLVSAYMPSIEKEYLFWMATTDVPNPGKSNKRVVRMPDGTYLNRYSDDFRGPRPESYREDVITAEKAVTRKLAAMRFGTQASADSFSKREKARVYRHLRAAAESGWDFSSRWLQDPQDLSTIQTDKIVPVELNCLLLYSERLLEKYYKETGDSIKANGYRRWASDRAAAIEKYCYNPNKGFFTDYHLGTRASTGKLTAAGLFPLCFLDSTLLAGKIPGIKTVLINHLLAAGGLLTSTYTSGQQWDAPNGWAPLQWMAVWGLERCGEKDLAKEIASRWIRLNTSVFARTGKLMEKYNVVNTSLEAGGGEYPGQDGFGWTNGVLLALMEKYPDISQK